jgi:hypothetical protein
MHQGLAQSKVVSDGELYWAMSGLEQQNQRPPKNEGVGKSNYQLEIAVAL